MGGNESSPPATTSEWCTATVYYTVVDEWNGSPASLCSSLQNDYLTDHDPCGRQLQGQCYEQWVSGAVNDSSDLITNSWADSNCKVHAANMVAVNVNVPIASCCELQPCFVQDRNQTGNCGAYVVVAFNDSCGQHESDYGPLVQFGSSSDPSDNPSCQAGCKVRVTLNATKSNFSSLSVCNAFAEMALIQSCATSNHSGSRALARQYNYDCQIVELRIELLGDENNALQVGANGTPNGGQLIITSLSVDKRL
eukprot:gene17239-23564_t